MVVSSLPTSCSFERRLDAGLRLTQTAAQKVDVLAGVAHLNEPLAGAYHERLRAAGKPPKVALIAAIRKLLHAIYSVAVHRKPFVPRLPEAGT